MEQARKIVEAQGKVIPALSRRITTISAKVDCFLVLNGLKRGIVADYFIEE